MIDTTTLAVTPVTVGTNPGAIALTPDGAHAYVLNYGDGTVSVIDTTTLAVTPVTVGANPWAITFTPDGAHAYVLNNGDGTVSVIDTTTLAVTPVTVGANPQAIAFTPDGAHAYVPNFGDGTVSVIDTTTLAVTPVTVGANPVSIAFTPDGTHAYVLNSGGGTVSVIDTTTLAVTPVTVGAYPYAIAFTPDGAHAYVLNNGDGTVSVITPNTDPSVLNVIGYIKRDALSADTIAALAGTGDVPADGNRFVTAETLSEYLLLADFKTFRSAIFTFDEKEMDSWAAGGGTLIITLSDFLSGATAHFVGTPVLSAPVSLEATVALSVAGTVATITCAASDTIQRENITLNGYFVQMDAGAPAGDVVVTVTGTFAAGCTGTVYGLQESVRRTTTLLS